MECHGKTAERQTHNEKTPSIDFIHIFWIKEEVGNPHCIAQSSADKRPKQQPKRKQHMVGFHIIDCQMNWKRQHELVETLVERTFQLPKLAFGKAFGFGFYGFPSHLSNKIQVSSRKTEGKI